MTVLTKAYLGSIPLLNSATPEQWMRPIDWLPMPSVINTDQIFVGLLAIYNHSSNFIALLAQGNYTVDWGDGVIENFSSNTQAQHIYDYSTISNTTESVKGYRQVIVTVTPQAGQTLTTINLQRKHTQSPLGMYNSPWLDIIISGGSISNIRIGASTANTQVVRMTSLERCQILSNSPTISLSFLFQYCYSLQSVSLLQTSLISAWDICFAYCYSLKTLPLFDTSSATTFFATFFDCYSLESLPLFNTASVLNFNNMVNNCVSLQRMPPLNTSSGTSFTSMISACPSLSSAAFVGTSKAPISYAGCRLSRQAIVDIFNGLGTAIGSTVGNRTINVSNNWGSASLTAGDIAIATAKNWTVVT